MESNDYTGTCILPVIFMIYVLSCITVCRSQVFWAYGCGRRKRQVDINTPVCTAPDDPLTLYVNEDDGQVIVEIAKTGYNNDAIDVLIQSTDGTANGELGYISGQGTFPPSTTSPDTISIVVFITDDNIVGSDQSFFLTLSVPEGNAKVVGPSQLEIVIQDNDGFVPSASPLTPDPGPEPITVLLEATFALTYSVDLGISSSSIFMETVELIRSPMEAILRTVTDFLNVRVLNFRPGSVIAELEVTLDPASGGNGDDVLTTLRQNISPSGVIAGSDLAVDSNSIQITAELCPSGYCKNDGTCRSDIANRESTCSCVNGFSGERCGEGGEDVVVPIILPLVMTTLSILVMVTASFLMCCVRRQRQEASMSPVDPRFSATNGIPARF